MRIRHESEIRREINRKTLKSAYYRKAPMIASIITAVALTGACSSEINKPVESNKEKPTVSYKSANSYTRTVKEGNCLALKPAIPIKNLKSYYMEISEVYDKSAYVQLVSIHDFGNGPIRGESYIKLEYGSETNIESDIGYITINAEKGNTPGEAIITTKIIGSVTKYIERELLNKDVPVYAVEEYIIEQLEH